MRAFSNNLNDISVIIFSVLQHDIGHSVMNGSLGVELMYNSHSGCHDGFIGYFLVVIVQAEKYYN